MCRDEKSIDLDSELVSTRIDAVLLDLFDDGSQTSSERSIDTWTKSKTQPIEEILDIAPLKVEGEWSDQKEEILRETLELLRDGWEGNSFELLDRVTDETNDALTYCEWWDETVYPVLETARQRGYVTDDIGFWWRGTDRLSTDDGSE